MIPDAQQQLQKIRPMIHHSPVAMAELNEQGALVQLNPKAVQLMMPLAMYLGLPGDNLLDILKGFLPLVGHTVADFSANSGLIIAHEPYIIRFTVQEQLIERHFRLTIEKTSPTSLLVYFEDVTDFLIKADALRQRI